MRLALMRRKKALAFVSSVGVLGGLTHPDTVQESEHALALASEHPGDGGYALGCAALNTGLAAIHDSQHLDNTVSRLASLLKCFVTLYCC